MNRVASVVVLVGCLSPLGADDRTDRLRKEIAELRSQLAAKEAQLSKLEPVKELEFLTAADLTVGTAGEFRELGNVNGFTVAGGAVSTFEVMNVIDEGRMVIRCQRVLIVVSAPTTGYAEGKVFVPDRRFRVKGTEKVKDSAGRDRTLFVVEPYSPKQK